MNHDVKADSIYATPQDSVKGFAFDDRVAQVFADMISRSVPGYATVISMSSVLANQYVRDNTNCYDLGCSLGATTLALDKGINAKDCRIIGIDNSSAMLERAKKLIALENPSTEIQLLQGDVREVEMDNGSIITLNFTLQFVPLEERPTLIRKIYQALRPGGILVLSEKIAFDEEELETLQIEMHHAFKKANGYNDLEISQKRSALENVLIPETLDIHRQRLLNAGFKRADLWFQCFNFVSIVARK